MRALIAIALAFLVASCGFQLRGTQNAIHHSYTSIRVVDKSGDKAFVQALSNALQNSGVDISEEAINILTVLASKSEKRTASFSSRAKSAEYELLKHINFQFQQDQDLLIENTQLLARRSYLYRETAAVGKAEEENLLRKEMDVDLAQRILISLQRTVQTTSSQATP